jgi:glycosyltransferase involved in cell wall biosynthesis
VPVLVFDVRSNHDTGVSRYGLSLLTAAAPLLVEKNWRLVVVAGQTQTQRAEAAVKGLDAAVLECPAEDGFVRRSPWLRELLVHQAADLYYTSHYTVDLNCPTPFIFTIHDLSRLRFPELFTDDSFVARYGVAGLDQVRKELVALGAGTEPLGGAGVFTQYFRVLTRQLAARAQRILTVSEATARDIHDLLDVGSDHLALAPCGIDTEVFHRRADEEIENALKKYGLTGRRYLLFVGLTHPHKRFPWLVAQLLRHRHQFPDARLVAVGDQAGQTSEVRQMLADHGAQDFVVFTGRVPDAELAALYSGAAAWVTASVNEGNNLPPLEALACGCQVIATDIPPLRETVGRNAYFYDPARGEQLAALAADALGARLPDRASDFQPPSWSDAGRALFETCMETHRFTQPTRSSAGANSH